MGDTHLLGMDEYYKKKRPQGGKGVDRLPPGTKPPTTAFPVKRTKCMGNFKARNSLANKLHVHRKVRTFRGNEEG